MKWSLLLSTMVLALLPQMNSAADCASDQAELVDEIESMAKKDVEGYDTLGAAYYESSALWQTYQSRRIRERAAAFDSFLDGGDGGDFSREMDPGKYDSTNGILKNSYDDLQIMVAAIELLQKRQRERDGRSGREILLPLAKTYGLNPERQFFRDLANAFDRDDGRGNEIISFTENNFDEYRKWLGNGVEQLADERHRIQDVYIQPREDHFKARFGPENLKGDAWAVTQEVHSLVGKAEDATRRAKSALGNARSRLARLRNLSQRCALDMAQLNRLKGVGDIGQSVRTAAERASAGAQ
ncbi:MAG: hypothetical protein H6624_13605 [Bdellovibrionaceae bacterium]|nr:hypothetical protein [Bdellovibrionales bacterium]MCB9085379.1 hypothetical protein [Pseudobdellovibrionaceae bacterium]